MLLSQALQRYLWVKMLRPSSADSYKRAVASLTKHSGDQDLSYYTQEVLLVYRKGILVSCKPVTWNMLRRHLSAVFNLAVDEETLAKNPFKKVSAAPVGVLPKKVVDETDLLTNVENYAPEGAQYFFRRGQQRYLTGVWFWGIFCRVTYYTGMRPNQAVGLRWGDLDSRQHTLLLRSAHSKTLKEWTLPIPRSLTKELLKLRDLVFAESPAAIESECFIFQWGLFQPHRKHAGATPYSAVGQFFRAYSQIVGVKVSANRIRHTTATQIARKHDLQAAAHFLGHASIATTAKYRGVSSEDLRVLQKTLMKNIKSK